MQARSIAPLVQLVIGIALVEIVAIGGNTLISNRVYIKMSYVRYRVITEKNDKLLSINYQILEQPHILDLHQRASNAVGGNWHGFEGMMNRVYILSAQLVTIVVTAWRNKGNMPGCLKCRHNITRMMGREVRRMKKDNKKS